jgi:hypothetical protein
MADYVKRTECIKVCFEPKLLSDLVQKADREDRKLADVVYVIVRRFMYGDVNGSQPPAQRTNGED